MDKALLVWLLVFWTACWVFGYIIVFSTVKHEQQFPDFVMHREHTYVYTSSLSDLWYDPELGRYGTIGTGIYFTLGSDKLRFEQWYGDRANRIGKFIMIVRKGYGVYEAPLP